MNKKYLKILKHLYKNDMGEFLNISYHLKKYNIITQQNIRHFYDCLKEYIELDSIYNYRGLRSLDEDTCISQNNSELNEINRKVKISPKGREYVLSTKHKFQPILFSIISGVVLLVVGNFLIEPIQHHFFKPDKIVSPSNYDSLINKNKQTLSQESHDFIIQNGDKSIGKIENQTIIKNQNNFYKIDEDSLPKFTEQSKADLLSLENILDQLEYAFNNNDTSEINNISLNNTCLKSLIYIKEYKLRQPKRIEINQISGNDNNLKIGSNNIVIEYRVKNYYGKWEPYIKSIVNIFYDGKNIKIANCNFLEQL